MPATINCDQTALAKSSACYCYNDKQSRAVIIYLLKQLAGNTMTPAELGKAAACYCFDPKTTDAVTIYLLCAAASS